MQNNLIKSIVKHTCPHCKEQIFIESSMTPPTVNALFTMEDVATAKKDCLERIETLTLEDEKRDRVVKWVNDPVTIFGPNEVESIILSLLTTEE